MVHSITKGRRRKLLDLQRQIKGEPTANWEHNVTPHSKYEKGGKASRKKGRNRFKTGKKSGNR